MTEGDPTPDPFPRGAVDTIENKLSYFLKINYGKEDSKGMKILREAMSNSFTHVLRLLRVNTAACVRKHGPYFDKLKAYHDFVKDTSFELLGYVPVHPSDSWYLYKSREDAEKIAKVMVFRQENVELPLPEVSEKK